MLLTRAYYFLKPLLPWRLRMGVRRVVAQWQRPRYASVWPINPVAGKTPEGFPGWPGGKKFAFVLTHDVETGTGLARCRELAETDMRLGFRSSFNFIPEGRYITPRPLRDWLHQNGFEVGVHDLRHDGQLYRSRHLFAAQARQINTYLHDWQAAGFRSGFMFRDLSWIQDLNIRYDASTFDTDPFEPQSAGVNTIFPFWVSRADGSGYVELPYTLPQDSTLFLVLQEKSNGIWKRKLDWVAERGGMALLNTHPDYVHFQGRKRASEYPLALYEEFLQYVEERYGDSCWKALPREVAAYAGKLRAAAPAAAVVGNGGAPSSPAAARYAEALPAGNSWRLRAKRAAMVSFSPFPNDPRVQRAADALVQEGVSVDMVCVPGEEKGPRREVLDGVEILRLPITRRRGGFFEYGFQYSAFILAASLVLAFRSLTRGYDVVYVHNMPDVLVVSALIPKLFGAKVILDLHDPMPELMRTIFNAEERSLPVRVLKRLEKWSMARADQVLTVNLACKRIFASRSCPEEKIGVVMNSPGEVFKFKPVAGPVLDARKDKPFVIMYHGTIVERNGLDLAVDALERVRKVLPNAELRVYGPRTKFLDKVMESVRGRGLQDAVHHLGPRRQADIAVEIEKCDLGVIPNQKNIFTDINTPTRIFEYLAVGKPVVAPRTRGIEEYFNSESLLFFDSGNAGQLAESILYAAQHPQETTEIVKRAQQVYLAHTWTQERRTLVSLVDGLLKSSEQHVHSVAYEQR
jgi:glycosyltransferase involved in cell wall biosynthesis